MKILFCVWHPKDINIIFNVIKILHEKNHEVKIVAALKENITSILDAYKFDYVTIKHYNNILLKALGLLKIDYDLYKISKVFKPDILIGGSPYAAHVGRFLGKTHICLSDTECATFPLLLTLPFSNVLCIPSCFYKVFKVKTAIFDSYFELAYLHPNYFSPNSSILEKLNFTKKDRLIILKFSSLNSNHDIGVKGLNFKTDDERFEFISKLEKQGRVLIISEFKLSKKLDKYRINIPATEFHDLLSFAQLYIGEGATMAAEAAILGIPSIYVSTTQRGYLNELENKYNLVYTISDRFKALDKALELLKDEDIKNKWQKKRALMLHEKIDTTKFLVDLIEKIGKEKLI